LHINKVVQIFDIFGIREVGYASKWGLYENSEISGFGIKERTSNFT